MIDRLPVIAPSKISLTEEEVHPGLQVKIAQGCNDTPCPFASVYGLIDLSYTPEMLPQKHQRPPETPLVPNASRQRFGLLEMEKFSFQLCKRKQHITKLEVKVDGFLDAALVHRAMLQRCQGLFKIGGGFPVGRAQFRFPAGLPGDTGSPCPRVPREKHGGRGAPPVPSSVGVKPLQGFDNRPVQGNPPVLQQAAIGHLMRQGMLEGIFKLRKERFS